MVVILILLMTPVVQAQENTAEPEATATTQATATIPATATPQATATKSATATATATATAVSGTNYTVRAGDTLFRIAQRFNLTTAQLAAANGITNPNLIFAGQSLIIPTGSTTPSTPTPTATTRPPTSTAPTATATAAITATPSTTPVPGGTYTVVRGDTLFKIAARNNTTVAELVRLNNLANPNLIFVGQVLTLPRPGSGTATGSTSGSTGTPNAGLPAQAIPGVAFASGIEVFIKGQDVNALSTQAVQLGVEWVKIVVNWRELEPTKGTINFAELDAAVNAFSGADLKVLLTLTGAPDWARPSATPFALGLPQYGPPDNVADFGTFAGTMAARYKGKVQAYEIWVEPNLRRSWIQANTSETIRPDNTRDIATGLSPIRYIDLLKAGRDAIKTADNAALIISAGLAPTGWNDRVNAIDDRVFLATLFDQGLAGMVDGIGVQPDGFANPPDAACCTQTPGVDSHFDNERFYFLGTINAYRKIATDKKAENLPLWITRFGWGTAEGNTIVAPNAETIFMNYNSPAEQATYLTRAFALGEDSGFISGMFLYNLNGCQANNGEACYYSLVNSANAARPAFVAIQNANQATPGTNPSTQPTSAPEATADAEATAESGG
jgi:LysM repeat protein